MPHQEIHVYMNRILQMTSLLDRKNDLHALHSQIHLLAPPRTGVTMDQFNAHQGKSKVKKVSKKAFVNKPLKRGASKKRDPKS